MNVEGTNGDQVVHQFERPALGSVWAGWRLTDKIECTMATPHRRRLAGLVATTLLAACGTVEPSPTLQLSGPGRTLSETLPPSAPETPSPTPNLTLADAEGCPVTQPSTAPPEIGDRLFGSRNAYGNDDLWVGGLPHDGILGMSQEDVDSDEDLGTKLGWWRNVRGHVEISGRRRDAPAPPLVGRGSDGFGTIGFQSSGIHFPTQGCWEITGSVGESELTFVMFVFVQPNA